jgi:hypothetical protein
LLKGRSLNQPLCKTLPIEIRETALRLSGHRPYNTSIREADPRNYLTQRLHAPKFSWLSLSNSSHPAVNLNRESLYLNDFPSLLCRLRICLLTNQTDKVYCIITGVILCTPYRRSSTLHLVETGWRFGVNRGALAAFLIFYLNLGVFIWTKEKLEPTENGTGQFYEGNCSTVRRLNTGIHLPLNILSTVLLGCSNYTMQCLSGPTRAESNDAHSRNSWLDIGVRSVGNFKHIHRSRTILWWVLAVSSFPLYLL